MATNTNYTTKTAALKATKADMRQVAVSKKIEIGLGETATQITDSKVSAEDLFVSVDGKEERQSVKTLIQQAQTDATNAAGIQVTRDLNNDYDNADPDEFLSVKTKKMNFYGTYVNVVQSTENPDEISIYIGENKNPAEFNTDKITSGISGSDGGYLYTGSNYSLGDFTANTYYAKSQKGGSETITVNGGQYITIPNKTSKVRLEAYNSSGVIAFAETAVIDGAGANEQTGVVSTPVTASSAAVTNGSTAGAITISVSSIVLNNSTHAKDGLTPGFIRCKVSGTIDNAKLLPNGGAYKVRMSINGKTAAPTTEMFVYNDQTTNMPSIGTPTATYVPGDKATKSVSGITYDTAAKLRVQVSDIKNTQYMLTSTQTRLKITDTNSYCTDIGEKKNSELTLKAGTTITSNDAEFSFDGTTDFVSTNPRKMTADVTVTPYKQGSAYSTGAKTVTMTGAVNHLWTPEKNGNTIKNETDTASVVYFKTDGQRLGYTVLTDANGDVTGLDLGSTSTYTSTTSLVDTGVYAKQLLIQDGKLMQPKNDVTGKYTATNCTGTRYWVKKVASASGAGDMAGSDIKITIPGIGMGSNEVKVWAVSAVDGGAGAAGAFSKRLNSLGAAGGAGLEYKNNVLTVNINSGQMTCPANGLFYLVIQIKDGSNVKVGQISIA